MSNERSVTKEIPAVDPAVRWIDGQDIQLRLHISRNTLYSWRSRGLLPYSRIGKKIFYRESDLEQLLNSKVISHKVPGISQK